MKKTTRKARAGDVIKLEKGLYVVERSAMEGGGTGHGEHDVYPDGWHVVARKLGKNEEYEPRGQTLDFYQSGCFRDLKPEVEIVGKMKKMYVWDKKWIQE